MRIPDPDAQRRLAVAIKRRRDDELHLRQEDVSARGGPSKAWLYSIENAGADAYHDAAIAKLERALLWEPGSVAAIVAGGDPTVLASSDEEADSVEPVELIYRGYRVVMYPNPKATPEEVARAQQSVLESVMEQLRQIGLEPPEVGDQVGQ
jgi:hypothetical protein